MNILLHTIADVSKYLAEVRRSGKSIGFVPTMGALHEGHLELVRAAGRENLEVIVCIFVNPIQFNNPEDLKKYPRTLDSDIAKLGNTPCTMVFAPSAEEMYPEPDLTEMEFGGLEDVMEGKFRPGHFRGVGIVVKKLFEIIQPDKAYFGEKDFQQLAIIKHMVKQQNIPVIIIPCATVREEDGLAMSSRNQRLNETERNIAPAIYRSLLKALENHQWFTPEGLEKMIIGEIEQFPELKVEYVSVVDAETLLPFSEWEEVQHAVVCVAVYLGEVRLIDNIRLY
ncbi:MAG: pantoate--beta-alanine ligase [Bacteroidales bacterium]|nr:pantoate--beta-alanine ligase [Bacteroidales bacterium]